MLFVGCAHKPTPPNRKSNRTASRTSILSSSKANVDRPAMPHQERGRTKPLKNPHQSNLEVLSPSDIFQKLSSAVFKIHTTDGVNAVQGSGFFIASNGVAVSNYHVFKGTAVGYEEIILEDGTKYKLDEVYFKSEENDFIIFKVRVPKNVNYITISSSTAKVGEKVYTIGSPRGLDNTFSSGEISQIRENGKILQISAPIDHGSSGGVLLNSKGEAIGITSGGIDTSGANLNFAWNINLIKSYIP